MPVMALGPRPKSSAYYRNIRPVPLISDTNGQPFVSTFEGPANADDWVFIKSETGCFFVPDWSSVGAKPALELAGGVVDGLFSWAAWPWAFRRMNTYVNASYLQYLGAAGGKPYMMPVSPWFYTNMPGYNWRAQRSRHCNRLGRMHLRSCSTRRRGYSRLKSCLEALHRRRAR